MSMGPAPGTGPEFGTDTRDPRWGGPGQMPSRTPHRPTPAAPRRSARALRVTLGCYLVLSLLLGPVALVIFGFVRIPQPESMAVMIIISIALVGLSLLTAALWVTNLVLSIIVVAKGRHRLRHGGLLALISVAVGSIFSLDITGDLNSAPELIATAATVLSVVGTVFHLMLLLLGVVAIWLLGRGLTELPHGPGGVQHPGSGPNLPGGGPNFPGGGPNLPGGGVNVPGPSPYQRGSGPPHGGPNLPGARPGDFGPR